MKKSSFLAIMAIVFTLTFTSCEKDVSFENQPDSAKTISNQNPNLHNLNKPELAPNGGPGIGGTIKVKVKFRLHRGRKWAKKHHTEPCEHSFGICSVVASGSVNVEVSTTLQEPHSNATSGETSVFRCKFLKPVDAENGDVFFSTEDAPFEFPTDIAEMFNYSSITVVPENYIYQGPSEDYPYGYVDVDCIVN